MKNKLQTIDSIIDRELLETWFLAKLITDFNFSNMIYKEFDNRWFKNSENAIIAKILLNFTKKYERTTSVKELGSILKGVVNKDKLSLEHVSKSLNDITEIIRNVSQDVLTDNVSSFVKKQAAWCAIIDSVNDIEKNPDDSVSRCLARLNEVLSFSVNTPDAGFDYFDEDEYNEHYDILLNPESRLSTGFDSVDTVTNGGFLKDGKSLYLIIGQSGLGKSLFLSNIALGFLKQNKTVVVISLEMSENIYAQRFDAHISNININELNLHENTVKGRLKNFKELYPEARLFLKEFPPNTISTSDIDKYLTDLVSIKGIRPDVIIVDYLNLLTSDVVSNEDMYRVGLDVAEKLRALSYKYEAPVITAAQVNTLGMNNEDVGMQNVANSRGIIFSVDFAAALFQTEENRMNGIISSRLLKNRLGGRVGNITQFKLDPATLILTDISGGSSNIQRVNNTQTFEIAEVTEDVDTSLIGDILDI